MRTAVLVVASLTLVTLAAPNADAEDGKALPGECPVTLPSARQTSADESEFIHGANSLHVWLPADGRWPGSPQTLRWYYKGASRTLAQALPPLKVTASRLDGDGPPATIAPPSTVMKDEYAAAMLTKVELPPGCWRVSAQYRGDSLSFVIWAE